MRDVLVDTNVILRLFDTISAPDQTARAKQLFEAAKNGGVRLVIGPPVLFEVAWVLRSALKWSNGDTLDVLEAIIGWRGVKTLDKDYVKQAISLGRETGIGFADSYLAITAIDCGLDVATFNERHFQKCGVDPFVME
ncbi:MAG: PIN domain-containing protein [Synergistaceae bacterium]|jgi:predicted nucleic-acid-binding protein|nr:PIN domain-containing protein [Synergistaceae bacterium]